MPTLSARPLVRVPVAPGAPGVAPLLAALGPALDGSGPAIAPVPVVSPTVSNTYVMSVLDALRPDDAASPLESDEIAVVVATSGSTGAPRGVLLSSAQLTSLSDVVNASTSSGGALWIAALPVTSMGGLNVLIRALATGNDPVVMPSIGGAEPFTPRSFTQAVNVARARSGDVRVSLVPAQVARLLSDDSSVEALRECASVLVGGGPMRPSLREMAAELGVSVTATYGATETSGGCVFDGLPLPGVSVSMTGGSGGPALLAITSPSVASGYRCDDEATRERFEGSTFMTTDIGTVDDEGRMQVLGRADDIVVIKGVNVSPGAIERVLDDLPDVVTAAAVAVTPASGEPQIWVFVEVRDEAPDIEARGSQAAIESLGVAARPHAVRRVDRLPHLPNGKVDRRLLEQRARDESGS